MRNGEDGDSDDAGAARESWLRFTMLVAPLAIVVLGAKLHKDRLERIFWSPEAQSAGGTGWLTVGRTLSGDLLFLGIWMLVWGLLLRTLRGAARGVAWLVLHVLTACLLTVALAEHAFYLVTGTTPGGPAVAYAIEKFGELRAVLFSQASPFAIAAAVGAIVAVSIAPAIVERTAGRRGSVPPRAAYVLAGMAIVVGAVFGRRHLESALGSNVFTSAAAQVIDPRPDAAPAFDEYERAQIQVEPAGAAPTRNVVLIVLESARATVSEAYDSTWHTSPFLASIARRGRRVDHAYTTVTHTSKALVSILCGDWPRIAMPVFAAKPGALPYRCLPEVLAENGYATAFFQAADETFEQRTGLVRNFGFRMFRGESALPTTGFEKLGYFGYEDDILLRPTFDWLDEQTKPFFLTVLTLISHDPYDLPIDFPRVKFAGTGPKFEAYLNTLRYTDRFVQQLYEGLQKRDLLDNTVVIITGDHGEGFGEHGVRFHDNNPYEVGVHVPMLLLGPGTGTAGAPIEGLRQITDIAPTVYDLLGLKITSGAMPGRSLLRPDGHDRIVTSCHYADSCMSLIEGGRKYIYHYGRRPMELFDLAADPMEIHDLAATARVADLDSALNAMLSWRARVNGVFAAHRIAVGRGKEP